MGGASLVSVTVASECERITPQVYREPLKSGSSPPGGLDLASPMSRAQGRSAEMGFGPLPGRSTSHPPESRARAVVSGNQTTLPVFTEAVVWDERRPGHPRGGRGGHGGRCQRGLCVRRPGTWWQALSVGEQGAHPVVGEAGGWPVGAAHPSPLPRKSLPLPLGFEWLLRPSTRHGWSSLRGWGQHRPFFRDREAGSGESGRPAPLPSEQVARVGGPSISHLPPRRTGRRPPCALCS